MGIAIASLLHLWNGVTIAATLPPITIDGLENHGGYTDKVSFKIKAEPGFITTGRLDDHPVAAGTWIEVGDVNYHELTVQRTSSDGQSMDATNVQFVVRSSERGFTEFGLPPWTPYPVIDAPAGQFESLQLQAVMPSRFPANQPLPVILLLAQTNGTPAWVNGKASVTGNQQTIVQLWRGFGSCLLPAEPSPGIASHRVQLHSLQEDRSTIIEPDSGWTSVSGRLEGVTNWPDNSRIFISGDVFVPHETILTIGPGSIVKLASLAVITVDGECQIRGLQDNPVVFMPDSRSKPWGGFVATNNAAKINMDWVILTGGGGNLSYFSDGHGLAHRMEQPLLALANGAAASLSNCFFIDNPGQMGNGNNATLTLEHCLVQRCITGGQFNGGSVTINRSALIEFPRDTAQFADQDEDAIYLSLGSHSFKETLIGWTRDDGIDAILESGKTVLVENCWFESCFHEGMAWSGYAGTGDIRGTVILNCGQASETGWSLEANGPSIKASRMVCLGNLVGARFADNYNWNYAGFLSVTNSILIFNMRDAWGMNFQDWQYRSGQMDVRGNFLGSPNPWHPDNRIWLPENDGSQLLAYMPENPSQPCGIGFATRTRQLDSVKIAQGIPVRLSCFANRHIGIDYSIVGADSREDGRLEFMPGETVQTILPSFSRPKDAFIVSLSNPKEAQIIGWQSLLYAGADTGQTPGLHWTRSGGELILFWNDPSALLEQAEASTGPWTTSAGSSPVTMPMDKAQRFYRLRK